MELSTNSETIVAVTQMTTNSLAPVQPSLPEQKQKKKRPVVPQLSFQNIQTNNSVVRRKLSSESEDVNAVKPAEDVIRKLKSLIDEHGIKAVAFDFDGTLVYHTKGQQTLPEDKEERMKFCRKNFMHPDLFMSLYNFLRNQGIVCNVATFASYKKSSIKNNFSGKYLVKEYLEAINCEIPDNCIKAFQTCIFNGSQDYTDAAKECGLLPDDSLTGTLKKNLHLKLICNHLKIKSSEILLIDDDAANVEKAKEEFVSIHAYDLGIISKYDIDRNKI